MRSTELLGAYQALVLHLVSNAPMTSERTIRRMWRIDRLQLIVAVVLCLGFDPGVSVYASSPDDPPTPHAVYPYFARPPALPEHHDTWADAKGPDVTQTDADPSRLPSRVDHSSRAQFPPIYKQKYGACGQFTAAASIFTYEMNVADGTVASSDETRFPAHFSWNMVNGAENRGSEAYHGWEVAKRLGLPRASVYGGVRREKIGQWPNGYEVWRDAMNYRVAGYRYTPAVTVAQLNEARGWLYDRNRPDADRPVIGGLLAMDGRMGELEKVTRTIAKGQYAAGEDVWIAWGPTGYGHGMTCVGYDDHVGYDRNGDGRITNDLDINGDGRVTLADWERGAYIIANSWGSSWSGDGKIYLLYSAMIDPTWKRGNYLGRIEVARHIPRLTLKLKLACNDRSNLRMTLGLASSPSAAAAEHTDAPEAFNGWPLFGRTNAGHVPLAGPGDDTPLEVGIDLTPLLGKLDTPTSDASLFITLTKADGSDVVGELHEAAVRIYDEAGALIQEQPLEIDGGGFGASPLQLRFPIQTPNIR